MPRDARLCDLTLYFRRETAAAICISKTDEFNSPQIWLPKSQIEYEFDRGSSTIVIVTLPEWLAREKGLI